VVKPRYDGIGRHVNQAARTMRLTLDSRLAAEGATFSSWMILSTLDERGGAIQRELAEVLGLEGPTVVRHVSQLEKSGLVTREPVPGDLRASRIVLTPNGAERLDRLRQALRTAETQLVDGIDPGELEITIGVLSRLTTRARELRVGG
jgi:MarR family transcriptional regulator for hemolysin